MLPAADHLQAAVHVLRTGGLIAYPTEAVWGLGCDPWNEQAVRRLLSLKQRDAGKGLIIIAADTAQIDSLLAGLSPAQRTTVLASWPGPVTWIVPVDASFPAWVRGSHDSVAVRVSAHAGVQALCRAFGGALISTSANRAGEPPMDEASLRQQWGGTLDYILPGSLGGDLRPSEIRDACTGAILRAR
jgi:L-threonylcarbamoyladenylate synthase